jgi:hypothetical protein
VVNGTDDRIPLRLFDDDIRDFRTSIKNRAFPQVWGSPSLPLQKFLLAPSNQKFSFRPNSKTRGRFLVDVTKPPVERLTFVEGLLKLVVFERL